MSDDALDLALPLFGRIPQPTALLPSVSRDPLCWRPPADLLDLHDLDRVAALLQRVMEVVREPIQPVTFLGRPAWRVMGLCIVETGSDGWKGGWLWVVRDAEMCLLLIPDHEFTVFPCPAGFAWLDAIVGAFGLELRQTRPMVDTRDAAAERCEQRYLAAVRDWLQGQLRRHADLRAMRARVGQALGLDPVTLRLARHTHHEVVHSDCRVSAQSWNLAVKHRAALLQVRQDAPQLLPRYGAMLANVLPAHTPAAALQTLRLHLARQGIRPATWRLLSRSSARLTLAVRRIYCGPLSQAMLEQLRILQAFKLREEPPPEVITAIWARDGNGDRRWDNFENQIQPQAACYGHLARCYARQKAHTPATGWPVLREELLRVVGWINEDSLAGFDKNARRAGWRWLVRQADARLVQRQVQTRLTASWPAPQSIEIGDFRLVPLGGELALWHEGVAMHHCAFDRRLACLQGETLIVSIRRRAAAGEQGRRVATAQYELDAGVWHLTSVLGPANAAVKEAIRRVARKAEGWIQQGMSDIVGEYEDEPGQPDTPGVTPLIWFVSDDGTLSMEGVETAYADANDDDDEGGYRVLDEGPIWSGQIAAMRWFEELPPAQRRELGVRVVDGEMPGSSYCAAELRVELDAANTTAERLALACRFRR